VRCAEKFHKRPHFDVVLLKFPDGLYAYARLQLLFSCAAASQQHQVALVTQFETVAHPSSTVIGMRKVKEKTNGTFISPRWIVRTVYLEPTFERNSDEWFVNDILDPDNFLYHLEVNRNRCM
jgi:hypothetical protein